MHELQDEMLHKVLKLEKLAASFPVATAARQAIERQAADLAAMAVKVRELEDQLTLSKVEYNSLVARLRGHYRRHTGESSAKKTVSEIIAGITMETPPLPAALQAAIKQGHRGLVLLCNPCFNITKAERKLFYEAAMVFKAYIWESRR